MQTASAGPPTPLSSPTGHGCGVHAALLHPVLYRTVPYLTLRAVGFACEPRTGLHANPTCGGGRECGAEGQLGGRACLGHGTALQARQISRRDPPASAPPAPRCALLCGRPRGREVISVRSSSTGGGGAPGPSTGVGEAAASTRQGEARPALPQRISGESWVARMQLRRRRESSSEEEGDGGYVSDD